MTISARLSSLAAAAWAALFCLVHVYWVLGGQRGLPAGYDLGANTPLLVIDVLAVPLLLGATALAWWLGHPRSAPRALAHTRLLALGAAAAAVMLVHALPTIPDWVRLAGATRLGDLTVEDRFVVGLYEPFFLLGGLLYAAATLAASRAARPTGGPQSRAVDVGAP